MTPASMVVDGTFCVYQGAALGREMLPQLWRRAAASGSHTMRWGLEQSRNLMTVRVANDVGMDKVVRTIKAVGIGDYQALPVDGIGRGRHHRAEDGQRLFRARQSGACNTNRR